MSNALITENVSKSFKNLKALDSISLKIAAGEMTALIGPSGSGKSTFLRLVSGLMNSDKTKSVIKVFGENIMKDGIISGNIRKLRSHIGFIFQKFNLVDRLDLLTNVLAGHLANMPPLRSWTKLFNIEEKKAAIEALNRVNMLPWAYQKAKNLSGGQQQRAAIARTIVQKSKIILADEPIASLDPASSKTVMQLLRKINKEDKVTVLVTLHQVDYAINYCDRIIALKDGKIIYDGLPEKIDNNFLHEIYGSKFSETGIESDLESEIIKEEKSINKLQEYAEVKSQL